MKPFIQHSYLEDAVLNTKHGNCRPPLLIVFGNTKSREGIPKLKNNPRRYVKEPFQMSPPRVFTILSGCKVLERFNIDDST